MNSEFPSRFVNGDGETKPIRSIKHPARSSVTVYTGENFSGDAWYTENVSDVDKRPDFICSTFRFDNAEPTSDGLGLTIDMPQGSVKWVYDDCPTPV